MTEFLNQLRAAFLWCFLVGGMIVSGIGSIFLLFSGMWYWALPVAFVALPLFIAIFSYLYEETDFLEWD